MSVSPPSCSCECVPGLGFLSLSLSLFFFPFPPSSVVWYNWCLMWKTGRASQIPHCPLVLFLLTPSACCEEDVTVFIMGFSTPTYLLLKSTSLLLKSCCSEIVDDIHHCPVCRIRRPPVLHGTAKHKPRHLLWWSVQECVAWLTTQSPRAGPGQLARTTALSSLRGPDPGLPLRTIIILVFLGFKTSLLLLAQSLFSS